MLFLDSFSGKKEIKRKFTCSPSTYGTYRKSNLTFDWITHESNKIKSTILPGWTVLEQFKALLILDDTSYCNFKIKEKIGQVEIFVGIINIVSIVT